MPGGLETPDFIELRKRRETTEDDGRERSLYQVIPERETSVRGFMGSERGYDVSGFTQAPVVLGAEERGGKVRR